jgi:putative peptidoglycan lipid II flippase
LDTSSVAVTFGKTAVASTFGGLAGAGLVLWVRGPLGDQVGPVAQAWIVLLAGTVAAMVVTLIGMRVVRLAELNPLWQRLARR